jgi:hypothetical protein
MRRTNISARTIRLLNKNVMFFPTIEYMIVL